jgi:hypothetical protein
VATSLSTAVLILLAAFIAPYMSDLLNRWMHVPSVVLEIILGAAIGPAALGWAHVSPVIGTIVRSGRRPVDGGRRDGGVLPDRVGRATAHRGRLGRASADMGS